jgi:hypothetical protein
MSLSLNCKQIDIFNHEDAQGGKMKAAILSTLVTVAGLFSVQAHANAEIQVAPTNPAALVGTWSNTNASTGNIVKVVVRRVGTGITVQPFGACSPTPCDHGITAARGFSSGVGSTATSGFNAVRNFGFKSTTYVGILQGPSLYLTTQNTFAAGDSRFNYTMMERFVKTSNVETVDQPSQNPIDHASAADNQFSN